MLNALIIDDDPRDQELLSIFLKKYCAEDIHISGTADSVASGYELISTANPDVVFLDVELGQETGFELLSKFEEFDFRVIFVTAYDKYALQAIKFNALDYILKPVEIAELEKAVKKIKELGKISVDTELKNLIHNLSHPHQKSNKLAVPVLNGYKMVAIEDILYCEANKEYTYIHCSEQPVICSSINLGEYEDLLNEYDFCRVHHSYLVNKEHVKQYVKGEGGEIMINTDVMIPVSRRKKQDVLDWLVKK